ncbi:hypothetical protein D3C75_543800 [compost metagenome]
MADWVFQTGRNRQLEQAIECLEVVAKQQVEAGDRVWRVVVAQPPEPVRTFAAGQALQDLRPPLGAQPAAVEDAIGALFGGAEQFPGAVLVGTADPGRQRAEHPAAGRQAWQADATVAVRGGRLAQGDGADGVALLQRRVEVAEEIPAVVRVILPGVFAIEKHRDQVARILLVEGIGLVHEVLGGIAPVPLRVLEADLIGE